MKLNLIYYKNILDIAIEKFVQLHEDCFRHDGNAYVLGLNASKAKLQKEVEECIGYALSKAMQCVESQDDVLLVIGSCYPKDNLLLSFKDNAYFPKKLEALIAGKPNLKWLMAEKDIEIDIELFNEIFINAFNESFCKKEPKKCMSSTCKVVYVSHSKLDCYMLFKTIKWAYGSVNCCNIWKDRMAASSQHLVAVNDLISKYIHNKSRMNKSKDFKKYALEVKCYLDSKLNMET